MPNLSGTVLSYRGFASLDQNLHSLLGVSPDGHLDLGVEGAGHSRPGADACLPLGLQVERPHRLHHHRHVAVTYDGAKVVLVL